MNPASFRRGLVLAALWLAAACLPAAVAQNAAPAAEPAPPPLPLSAAAEDAGLATLFREGMTALAAAVRAPSPEERDARLDAAIAVFHAMLVRRPGLLRVHLELARAFFFKGEDSLAREHFETVLAGDPPPAVVANIRPFLDTIRARRAWTAHFGAALAPDSNINAASADRTVWLDTPFGRLPFVRGEETAPQSGIGLSLWGGGEYQYPLAPRWRLRAGANASRREYRGGEFDRTTLALQLGPRWLAGPATEFSLLGTVRRDWAGGAPEADRRGLRLESVHNLNQRLQLRGSADWSMRDCRDCDWLDGPIYNLSLDLGWAATPTLRANLRADWQRTRADGESWRSTAIGAQAGATLSLPWGFTVGASAALRRNEYEGSGAPHRTIDRAPRADDDRTLSASVFNRAFTLYGFSPRIAVHRHKRDTNAQALDYTRTSGELSFVKQF